jgi:hypothetical protein
MSSSATGVSVDPPGTLHNDGPRFSRSTAGQHTFAKKSAKPCVQQRARHYGNGGIGGNAGNGRICNFQNLKNPVGFESHPLRQYARSRLVRVRL